MSVHLGPPKASGGVITRAELEELAATIGLHPDDIEWTLNKLLAAPSSHWTPRQELLWRLNEQWSGRDPGEPLNWRGLRGMK